MHNIEDSDFTVPPGTAYSEAVAMRDVANGVLFWSVQVVGAYEGAVNEDFDLPQPENNNAGFTWGGSDKPFSFVYLETIRDFTVYVSLPDYPPTFGTDPEDRAITMESRTAVHEVAHTFLGGHTWDPTQPADSGIMNVHTLKYGTWEANRFNLKQLALIQGRVKPNATP